MIKGARPAEKHISGFRPSVPSRATYWLWFGLAVILVFGMFAYLIWARSRGLLSWNELWAIESNYMIGGSISLVIGMVFRWRWSSKMNALHAYEEMLASIASRNGS